MTADGRDDRLRVAALVPPLAAQLLADGPDAAAQRLLVIALALVTASAWASLFARRFVRPDWELAAFAVMFVVLLPGAVALGAATLAVSFGTVFGREIFGGRAILPPALVGLAFAVFSFPGAAFEARGILSSPPNLLLAASCVPGAAVLVRRGAIAWQVVAGAVAGAAAVALLMGDAGWWRHPGLGAFAPGIVFLAAAPESAVGGPGTRWLHGLLVGALIVVVRLGDPNQPDGVIFAALLGAVFAPLIHRALTWRAGHD